MDIHICDSDSVELVSKGTDLLAILHGPSGDTPASKVFVLDATQCSDPDDPHNTQAPMKYQWTCRVQGTFQPCFSPLNYLVSQCSEILPAFVILLFVI